METETFATLVQVLQITVATSLIFIGGLSSCLSLWVLPLTKLLPPALACAQFIQTVTWGLQYLQPSSRILGISLLTTALLTSYLPDPAQAEQWKTWAVALAILAPVAPYEVYCIFPINDRVSEIREEVERGANEEKAKKELKALFSKWQFRNYGRVGIPLVAGIVGWYGITRR
ncbi:hypothetical protein C7974DRAFT_214216 [Boeremia exigua]|uniref:uncharacterized protein n=1 Tax=Boeremia exigua TaxID=749465 RepID=UPI001E8DE783|nr:uncharacterized protein C7974DRAFT_214216 [Boeremia exigua]KAH6621975.1 hypothetical protein C7974DRAFT_214216 [Boeremia exigua]